ncbi:hypothetical protein A2419_02490 [Candidatus Adlerbacteria bacterium RIFOXYC1_FULL_48_26]|uniref:Uncharacterized protein n=1 Tax=Candidatus Adlerbacteria bacterium RIFOXYC1_FULL_48_26 TaxID=1797247 RepID=A0A1F4Y6H2_9BACT|nr:MAG: hypothetical protein A2419_02490 [Candidatus Adlerbacteria bacterium RIFOXYC1_FULL_48_26]
MRRYTNFLAVLVVVSFALHALWEYSHVPLYTGYEQLGSGLPLILWATSGDVLYTLLITAFVFLCSDKVGPWRARQYAALGIGGFVIALLVEYKAMALHKWAYTAAMPIWLGVGISPIAQMALLVPLSVYISWRFTR